MPADGVEQDAAAAEPLITLPELEGRPLFAPISMVVFVLLLLPDDGYSPISAEYAGKEEVKVRNDTWMIFVHLPSQQRGDGRSVLVRTSPSHPAHTGCGPPGTSTKDTPLGHR